MIKYLLIFILFFSFSKQSFSDTQENEAKQEVSANSEVKKEDETKQEVGVNPEIKKENINNSVQYYQNLINNKECGRALIELQKLSSLNSGKSSYIFDALFVEAAYCDGRFTYENKKDALKILDSIKKEQPLLVGLNKAEFERIYKDIEGLECKDCTSGGDMLIGLISLIAFLGALYLLFILFENKFKKISNAINSKKELEKIKVEFDIIENETSMLLDETILKFENMVQKAEIEDKNGKYVELNKLFDSLFNIKKEFDSIKNEVSLINLNKLKFLKKRIKNIEVISRASF
jgi:hypothetical protein